MTFVYHIFKLSSALFQCFMLKIVHHVTTMSYVGKLSITQLQCHMLGSCPSRNYNVIGWEVVHHATTMSYVGTRLSCNFYVICWEVVHHATTMSYVGKLSIKQLQCHRLGSCPSSYHNVIGWEVVHQATTMSYVGTRLSCNFYVIC